MKSPLIFGLGVVSGAIVTSALMLVSSEYDHRSKEAEIVILKESLSRAQKASQQDREALSSWLREAQAPRKAPEGNPSSPVAIAMAPTAASADSAIATYLGAPVPTPADLDQRYSPEEISAVFQDLTETLGIKVDKMAVDTAEFPFVIHGRVESAAGAGFFKKIDSELRTLPGYTYGGSVTGSTKEGSTYFALNITPSSAYPSEHAEAIRRRLMLRLQMIAAAWGESQ